MTKPAKNKTSFSIFIFAIVAMFSSSAFAKSPARTPTRGRLRVQKPEVTADSWNGHEFRQRPVRRGTGWVGRARDPMAVRLTGLNPGDEVTIQRQGRSKALGDKLSGCIACKALPGLAKEAVVWKDTPGAKLTIRPTVESRNDVHVEIFRDPSQVFWPNSRARLVGQTRHGQAIPETLFNVTGATTRNVTGVFNYETNSAVNIRESGRFLPSARAWIQQGNLLVSEPTRDKSTIGRGKFALHQARKLKAVLAKLEALKTKLEGEFQTLQQAQPRDNAAIQKHQKSIQRITQRIAAIPQHIQKLEADGKKMIADGQVVRSTVLSIGAVPLGAQVRTTNTRIAGERGPLASFTGTASADSGFLRAEVGGIRGDQLQTSVTFAAVNNRSVGSTITLTHAVPNPKEQKADVIINGVRYFKVKATNVETQHDAPDAAPR